VIVNLPPVELSQADYERLQVQAGKTDITPILATWVRYFIQQQLGGGVLVSGNSVRQIEKILGSQVTGEKSIVDAIGKTKGVEDGQYILTAKLDPIYIEPLNDFCKANGVPPEFVLQDICCQVVENGWMFEWRKHENQIVNFTAKAWKRVCKALGMEKPFGQDIADHLDPEGKE
jgi:hypothetical protein